MQPDNGLEVGIEAVIQLMIKDRELKEATLDFAVSQNSKVETQNEALLVSLLDLKEQSKVSNESISKILMDNSNTKLLEEIKVSIDNLIGTNTGKDDKEDERHNDKKNDSKAIIEYLSSILNVLEKPKEEIKEERPEVQKVEVTNFPSNEVSVVKPSWYEGISYKKLVESLKSFFDSTIIKVKNEEIVRVNIFDSKGKIINDFSPIIRNESHGGGGPGDVWIKGLDGKQINPSTEEKQDALITAIENIEIPPTPGVATEAKQDIIITAIENIEIPIPAGASTESKQDALLSELQKKTEPTDIQLSQLILVLRNLVTAIANPSYVDKSANQMRAQITGSLTSAGTVSTVTTVTNLTNMGSYPADHLQRMDNMTAWATNVRSLIT